MFNSPRTFLILLATILVFSILTPRALASDDFNPSGLTPTVNTSGDNTTTNQTITATNQLLQENSATWTTNNNATQPNSNATQDPHYQQFLQLLKQYENQAESGNNIGAAQTLAQLQQYLQSPDMQQYLNTPEGRQLISPALQSLLLSVTDTSNGFSVDPATLQSYMGPFNNQGLPTGWANESPFQSASDERILGNLMNNIDPKTGLNLLQNSNLLNDEIGQGLFGKIPTGFSGLGGLGGLNGQGLGIPSIPKAPDPFGNIPGGSLGHPTFPGVPSLPSAASSVPGVPSIPRTFGLPTLPIIIVAIAGAAVLLFIFRKRFGMLGRRITPATTKTKPLKPDTGLDLKNPRDLIIYYFRKVTAAMGKRGVPRLDPETHREFTVKCEPRPESPPVHNISVLYEKALFSGRDVTMPEADDAKGYSVQVETVKAGEQKRKFSFRSSRSKIG